MPRRCGVHRSAAAEEAERDGGDDDDDDDDEERMHRLDPLVLLDAEAEPDAVAKFTFGSAKHWRDHIKQRHGRPSNTP